MILKQIQKKIHFSGDRTEVRILKNILTFRHPEAENIPLYWEKNADGSRKWDGKVKHYDSKNSTFSHGFIRFVLRELKKKTVDAETIDFIDNDVSWVEFSEPFLSDERSYQREAIKEFLRFDWGIIKIPTRGGKTYVASEIIRLALEITPNLNVLYITEDSAVFRQNTSEIAKFLRLKDIGELRGEKLNYSNINIAMMQTLQSKLKTIPRNAKNRKEKVKIQNVLKKFIKTVDFLIIDETQEFLSKDRRKVLRKFKNAKRCLSISATPFKKSKPIDSLNLMSIIGDVLYEVPEERLESNGILAENRVALICVIHKVGDLRDMKYQALLTKLFYENNFRNSVIKKVIDVCSKLGLKLLIMSNSKVHVKSLSSAYKVPYLCGDNSEEEIDMGKDKFLSSKGGCMVVSEIWKKGVTLTEVLVFLNISTGTEETAILQKRGRVLGAKEGKTRALFIDLIDFFPKYFASHGLKRIEVYENNIGKEKIDILRENEKLEKKLENYMKKWFDG